MDFDEIVFQLRVQFEVLAHACFAQFLAARYALYLLVMGTMNVS